MKKTKNTETEVTTVQSTEENLTPREVANPIAPPSENEEVAKTAYAKIAEELKWKGDFPKWDKITDRARALYEEGAAHVQAGNSPRTRYEEVVAEVLHG